MQRWILVAVTFLPLLFAWNKSHADEIALQGLGTTSCAEFAQMYKNYDTEIIETAYFSWSQGYMSGINSLTLVASGKSQNLSALSVEKTKAKLRIYCDAHPLLPFFNAVLDVYRSLPSSHVQVEGTDLEP